MVILLVEDDELVREMLQAILKQIFPESKVIACPDGQQAFAAIDAEPAIDLLITDGQYPGRSSGEVAAKFSEKFPHSLTIAITGDDSEWGNLEQAGVRIFFLKPVRLEELKKFFVNAGLIKE